ncbi:MAG: endolytic transglycosylase MltG [Cyanobacteria bacterium Co-bin13]|nr:endolytic transglycosylase MltG [Cyanobacteria bacterium Co-bin13]
MTKKSPWVKGLFYVLLLPAAAGIAAWQGWSWWNWASGPVAAASSGSELDQTVQIQIPPGTPGQQIGYDLEAAGLIRSATAWKLWSRWKALQDGAGGFQAGTYALSPVDPLSAIANSIWEGEVVQTSFTVPEGWNRKQMAQYFEAEGFFPAADFLAATETVPRDRFPWLPETVPHLEGFLYPDTYQLPAASITASSVVEQMLTRFEQVALPLYQQTAAADSLLDWVTLSSIVEKEAVIPEERPLIAGVFAKRLEQGMTLGADPTVEYGLGIEQTPEQPLTWAQVETPSPYNTYLNPGLPPTPIASPGLASLEASLNPQDTDYLYFVARYDGSHVFSRTLAEHEAAQAQIRDAIDAQTSAGGN